jgi:quinoprotein glucose dehydrogenase
MGKFLVAILLFCSSSNANILASQPASIAGTYKSWNDYGGSADAAQYSALKQIDRSNVSKLQVAWTFPTGDQNRYGFNPLVVDGLVYVLAEQNSVIALDAATGSRVWTHRTDPKTRLITNRGINYWESPDRSDRRLLFAESNFLQELDARTGVLIRSFGTDGKVDLREGLGRDPASVVLVQSTTPGKVFENLIILGSATNQEYESAPGDIRAYDVRSGKLVWAFHTVPHPGEFGYDTWPKEAWKTVGGANAWSELSLDQARGIVYIPTGSPKYNFYGADRTGANLFGDCLLALDARSGTRLWHFQMVHHDIWDYDNATAPKLLTVQHDGRAVDVVAQVGKEGFVWVFDRVTGAPLWPIEERAVPRSDMPGEHTWPTQPFPANPPPFARQKFTVEDLSPFISDPQERARIRDEMLSARNEGLFTPPGLRKTIQMPGNNGGANWGGAAADPTRGLLYVVSKDLPAMLQLVPEHPVEAPINGTAEQRGFALYQARCQLCHHADLKGQPPTVPALVHLKDKLSGEQVKNIVRQGQGPMPAFALAANELDDLTAFLFASDHKELLPPAKGRETDGEPTVTRYRSGFGFMLTSNGLSPIKPPWTSLTAYDLNKGTIEWKIPLGEVPELAAKGFKDTGSHFPKVGPVVTAGGLIFTGTHDGKVRALDRESGKVLWEFQLAAPLEGMPAVFETRGREYVVFCAAAQPAARSDASHGAYIAFALP